MIALILFILLLPFSAQATTYYWDDNGSDAANGLTTGTPWKTWTKVNATATCGDTVIVMDGTYNRLVHGNPIISKVCTQDSPFTMTAQNERQARFASDGLGFGLRTLNAAYIVLNGLFVSSVDATIGTQYSTVQFRSSDHITWYRGLTYGNNRKQNTHSVELYQTTNSLVEESEAYFFHRHGFINEYGSGNVFRRNYCNPRGAADIDGGYGPTGDPLSGDDCFINYPGDNNIFENNIAEGRQLKGYAVEAPNPGSNGVQFLGNIAYNVPIGLETDARGGTLTNMPQNTIIKDMVVVNTLGASSAQMRGIYLRGDKNTTLTNFYLKAFDNANAPGGNHDGLLVSNKPSPEQGDGNPTAFMSNGVISDIGGQAFRITTGTNQYNTWTLTNVTAFSSTTAYSPSSHANYSGTVTTDPQMGTCYAWRPDGSNAKTNGRGADILYRYDNGVLTTTPLWDTSTGKFPQGATYAGINDVAGNSLFDVESRLNINTGGCSFPSGYAGAGPSNPSSHVSSQGTTSTSHAHVIPAGMDSLHVCVALWKTGGSVGSVSAVASSGEALSFVDGITSPGTFRRVELWRKLNPTSGSRTITVSTTGSVDGTITDSIAYDNVLDFNVLSKGNGNSTAMSVTALTSTNETVIDCIATGKSFTINVGADQTLKRSDDHSTQALRLSTSEQAGSAGGFMDWTNSGATDYAQVAVSLSPVTPLAGGGFTLTLSKYRWEHRGLEASPILSVGTSTATTVATNGSIRLRAEISAGTGTTTPLTYYLYCQTNGGGYQRVMDTYGSNKFKLFGTSFDPYVPSSGTATTQQLSSGNFVSGYVVNTDSVALPVGAMTSVQKTEMVWNLDFNATKDDVITCRPYLSNGTALDTYSVTPTLTIVTPSATIGP